MNTNIAKALQEMTPVKRQKLLRVADNLTMLLRKTDLKAPSDADAGDASQSKSTQPSLGVICLDYSYEPAIGDVDDPGSFAYPVVYRTVEGLTFEKCQQGVRDDNMASNFKDAVKYLVDQGCDAITGDCGFMYWYQEDAREVTNKPMLLSSLCQLPTITAAICNTDRIAIFTADGDSLAPMLPLIKEQSGVDVTDDRYTIVGCQDVPGFDAVANGDEVIYDVVAPGLMALARQVLQDDPTIKAILLECTELPQFADEFRKEFLLPVHTAITCADHFMAGLLDNPRFGLQDWQEESDDVEDSQKQAQTPIEEIVSRLETIADI